MYQIRLAKPLDASEILNIYAPYVLNTTITFELEVPSITDFTQRVEKYLEESPWLVYEKKGVIAGYAYASAHRGRAAYQWNREVSVYVHDAYKRQGIAKKLYTTLFQLLRLQGYTNALAGIVQPNQASVAFHKSLGFQLVGTYNNIGYKLGAWQRVSWYELALQQTDHPPTSVLSMKDLKKEAEYIKLLKNSGSQNSG